MYFSDFQTLKYIEKKNPDMFKSLSTRDQEDLMKAMGKTEKMVLVHDSKRGNYYRKQMVNAGNMDTSFESTKKHDHNKEEDYKKEFEEYGDTDEAGDPKSPIVYDKGHYKDTSFESTKKHDHNKDEDYKNTMKSTGIQMSKSL